MFESPAPIVLVVENEPQILGLVCRILSSSGFTVVSALTAEEALRFESEFTGTIDLLITAFTLGKISGPDLAEKLEWRRPGLAVMLMSGYTASQNLAHRYGWYYTSKPFMPSAFLGTAKTAMGRGLTN